MNTRAPIRQHPHDEGYMLLAVVVLVFIILLMLSIAAPQMAKALKHDQEIETKHRADQYVRAIRMYYRKTRSYPPSMEVLTQKTNGQRYLRQKYLDPLTGKDDWRIIIVGQNKTKIKGLFGQDLPGLTGGGLGSAAGMQSTTGGNTGSAFNNSGLSTGAGSGSNGGSSFGSGSGSSFGSSSGSSFGSRDGTIGSTPQAGTGATTAGSGANSSSPASGFPAGSSAGASPASGDAGSIGTTGPIMGVGVPKDGASMLTVNDQTNYKDWEFLYDPRTEPNGATGVGGGGTGTSNGTGIPGLTPGSGTGTNPTSPNNPSGPTTPTNPGDNTTNPPTPIPPVSSTPQ